MACSLYANLALPLRQITQYVAPAYFVIHLRSSLLTKPKYGKKTRFLSILLNEYRLYHYIKKRRLLGPGSLEMLNRALLAY